MKFLIVFLALFVVVLAAHSDDSKHAEILKYESHNIGVDGYKFNYETSDGIARHESGQLKDAGTKHEAIAVEGAVSWTAPDGHKYSLKYVADEHGFKPEGEHLPVAPHA